MASRSAGKKEGGRSWQHAVGSGNSCQEGEGAGKRGVQQQLQAEQREAPNWKWYTKEEFQQYYGGLKEWDAAAPDWTEEEQQALAEAMEKTVGVIDPTKRWKEVAKCVGTRDAQTCADRWRSCHGATSSHAEKDSSSDEEGPPDEDVLAKEARLRAKEMRRQIRLNQERIRNMEERDAKIKADTSAKQKEEQAKRDEELQKRREENEKKERETAMRNQQQREQAVKQKVAVVQAKSAANTSKRDDGRRRKEEAAARAAAEALAAINESKGGSSKEKEKEDEREVFLAPKWQADDEDDEKRHTESSTAKSSTAKPKGKADADQGKGKGRNRKPKRGWWSSIDTECPISLVRIGDLDAPPFVLTTDGSAAKHYFDARFLANWLVSSLEFIDPINRRQLTREECVSLDGFIVENHGGEELLGVADAFDLCASSQGNASGVQREANAIMQRLFRFQSSRPLAQRRHDATGRAIGFSEGGLTVVDDDDIVDEPPPPPVTLQEGDRSVSADFPSLGGDRHITQSSTAGYPASRGGGAGRGGGSRGPQAGVDSFPALSGPPLPKAAPKEQAKAKAAPKEQAASSKKKAGKPKANPTKQTVGHGPKAWGAPKASAWGSPQ